MGAPPATRSLEQSPLLELLGFPGISLDFYLVFREFFDGLAKLQGRGVKFGKTIELEKMV
jgi:hypothetical protein